MDIYQCPPIIWGTLYSWNKEPEISQTLVSAHFLGGKAWLQGGEEEEIIRSYSSIFVPFFCKTVQPDPLPIPI